MNPQLELTPKDLMLAKARGGDWPGCAPVGYLNFRRGKKTWITIDRKLGKLVTLAFTEAAHPDSSIREILKVINKRGLTSRNGKPLQATGLWRILKNPFYTGQIVYKGQTLPGNHKPLVSKELFEQVQVHLQTRRRKQ